jgi:hypothetical protein
MTQEYRSIRRESLAPQTKGFPILLPLGRCFSTRIAPDVRSFTDRYVAAHVLAKRLNLTSRTVSSYIKECGAPLLAVPIPEEGRGPALFAQSVSSGEG